MSEKEQPNIMGEKTEEVWTKKSKEERVTSRMWPVALNCQGNCWKMAIGFTEMEITNKVQYGCFSGLLGV